MNAYNLLWKDLDALTEGLLNPVVSPRVDVAETKNHYELTAELPGFRSEEVTVQVKDGVLELTASPAEKAPAPDGDQTNWLLRERRQAAFQRSFRLPRDVDGESIEAAFRDGLLVLTLPKKEEAKPRVVAIKAA
jgi:HSP20 family protein